MSTDRAPADARDAGVGAELTAACERLTAAGEEWPGALPAGAQIRAQDHEYQRDHVTIGEHTLYRDDETGDWDVLGWSDASRARHLPRRRLLSVSLGLPATHDCIALFEDNSGGLTLLHDGTAIALPPWVTPSGFATDAAELRYQPGLAVENDLQIVSVRQLAANHARAADAERHVATWRPKSIYGDPATVTAHPPMGAAAEHYIGATAQEA